MITGPKQVIHVTEDDEENCSIKNELIDDSKFYATGKSLWEALLFGEHGEIMLCTEIVLNVKNNFCTQHVLPMFWAWNYHVLDIKPCGFESRIWDVCS